MKNIRISDWLHNIRIPLFINNVKKSKQNNANTGFKRKEILQITRCYGMTHCQNCRFFVITYDSFVSQRCSLEVDMTAWYASIQTTGAAKSVAIPGGGCTSATGKCVFTQSELARILHENADNGVYFIKSVSESQVRLAPWKSNNGHSHSYGYRSIGQSGRCSSPKTA